MAGQSEQGNPEDFGANSTGPHVLLQDINEPGAYVCHWNGDLLRVAEHGTPTETAPNLPASPQDQPLETTKISDDPFVPISRARLVASNFDLDINF